jgi:hypothetical protein
LHDDYEKELLGAKFRWYLNGTIERDEFKDINLRTTVGPGLGYQVFEDRHPIPAARGPFSECRI